MHVDNKKSCTLRMAVESKNHTTVYANVGFGGSPLPVCKICGEHPMWVRSGADCAFILQGRIRLFTRDIVSE